MNPRMKLAIADGSLYVLKEIGLGDTQMYQKLIPVSYTHLRSEVRVLSSPPCTLKPEYR